MSHTSKLQNVPTDLIINPMYVLTDIAVVGCNVVASKVVSVVGSVVGDIVVVGGETSATRHLSK